MPRSNKKSIVIQNKNGDKIFINNYTPEDVYAFAAGYSGNSLVDETKKKTHENKNIEIGREEQTKLDFDAEVDRRVEERHAHEENLKKQRSLISEDMMGHFNNCSHDHRAESLKKVMFEKFEIAGYDEKFHSKLMREFWKYITTEYGINETATEITKCYKEEYANKIKPKNYKSPMNQGASLTMEAMIDRIGITRMVKEIANYTVEPNKK